jgi:hypothetical protein
MEAERLLGQYAAARDRRSRNPHAWRFRRQRLQIALSNRIGQEQAVTLLTGYEMRRERLIRLDDRATDIMHRAACANLRRASAAIVHALTTGRT